MHLAPRGAVLSLRVVAGAALVLSGAGAVIASTASDPDPQPIALGGNLPVNPGARSELDISAHNSPSLTVNPRDQRQVVIANRIDSPRYSCALHASSDGGGSWRQIPIPAPRGEEPKCYAPDVAFGPDGKLYVSFVTLAGRGNVPHAAWLVTSADGGRTLSLPRRTLGELSFQVRLAADPRRAGRIYITWLAASSVGLLKFPAAGNPIQAKRSDDGGRTWSRPVRVSAPARERVVAPSGVVGADGALYVSYLDLGADMIDYETGGGRGGPPYRGRWSLLVARSRDAGASFAESKVTDRLVPGERLLPFLPPFPSLALDPDGTRLYLAFQDARAGDRDVYLWSRSTRAGAWRDTRVNDTPQRDRTSQYLPRVAVAPNGRVDVVYYDGRLDPRGNRVEVSFQSSRDRGASFGPRVRLSDGDFDRRIGFGYERGLPDLGSRLGLVSGSERALAAWADTRAGTVADKKQDIVRSVVAFSKPKGISDRASSALRFGGAAMVLAGLVLLGSLFLRRRPEAG